MNGVMGHSTDVYMAIGRHINPTTMEKFSSPSRRQDELAVREPEQEKTEHEDINLEEEKLPLHQP